MTDLRKAPEKALEALEGAYGRGEPCGAAITALRQALDLQTTIKRGTQAWADVPSASKWVEELRGNDKPPVKSYCGGKANYCTPEVAPEVTGEVTGEVPCKTDPRAPHGFDRNASHSADRYVCECEGWEPVDAVNTSPERVDETAKGEHKACYEIPDWKPGMVFPAPKRDISSWFGLTDDEIVDLACSVDSYKGLVQATEAKLKEKNYK